MLLNDLVFIMFLILIKILVGVFSFNKRFEVKIRSYHVLIQELKRQDRIKYSRWGQAHLDHVLDQVDLEKKIDK